MRKYDHKFPVIKFIYLNCGYVTHYVFFVHAAVTVIHGRIQRGAAGAAPQSKKFLLCLRIAYKFDFAKPHVQFL